jgi:hypothetical protein
MQRWKNSCVTFLIVSRKEQNYFLDTAYIIYLQFLIGNLCLEHGDFTNTACLWSKVSASEVENLATLSL